MNEHSHPTLLSPLELSGSRVLSNRIVMPPLVIWRAEEAAEVTEAHLRHYAESIRGCGLVVVEATTVSPEGRLSATQLGIFEERHAPGIGDLARLLRREGALPGIQLHHAGGKTDLDKTYGATPLVPSLLPDHPEGFEELTEEGILRIIGAFVAAARRAVDAGFELLEIHGAHGYLGSQFLSPKTNKRNDQWGGSLENRLRFLSLIVQRVRDEVKGEALVSCRLGVASGGVSIEDGLEAAERLAGEGLDMIHISNAGGSPEPLEGKSDFNPLLQLAKPVKERVSIPVIGIGGIRHPEEADAALKAGYGDLIAVGRGILADPGWARKVVEGKAEQIVECVQCQPKCFHHTDPRKCPTRKRLGIQPPGQ